MRRWPSKPFLYVLFHTVNRRLHLPVRSFGIDQPGPLSAPVTPAGQDLAHDNDVVPYLDALLLHEPAVHPPRSTHAWFQLAVSRDEPLPAVFVRLRLISGRVAALHKGVGDHGVFDAAGREPVVALDARVRGGGESDVEGDVDVRGQRHGVE